MPDCIWTLTELYWSWIVYLHGRRSNLWATDHTGCKECRNGKHVFELRCIHTCKQLCKQEWKHVFKCVRISLSQSCLASFRLSKPRDLSNPIQTYPNLSTHIKTYQNLSQPIKTYQNLSKPIKTYQNLLNPIKTYPTHQILSKPIKTFPIPSKPIQTYPNPIVCFQNVKWRSIVWKDWYI